MQTRWSFSCDDSHSLQGLELAALDPHEASAVAGLRDRVTTMLRHVLEVNGGSEDDAVETVEQHFAAQGVEGESRLVVAFNSHQRTGLTPETPVIGFSRVYETKQEGHRIMCTPLVVSSAVNDEQTYSVVCALFQVTQEVGEGFAYSALNSQSERGGTIEFWRFRDESTTRTEALFEQHGFSTSKFERVEMTKFIRCEDELLEFPSPEGIEIRCFDPSSDDLDAVYAVWELAYDDDPHPPCSTWESFYVKAPRFAPELSFVAWDDAKPVSGVFLEYVVEGEGGGDAGVWEFMSLVNQPFQQDTQPNNYEERKLIIRHLTTKAYVCAAGTIEGYRGRHLARTLLAKALGRARELGLDTVYLGTDSINEAALRAYKAAGMIETKRTVQGTMTVAEIRLSK